MRGSLKQFLLIAILLIVGVSLYMFYAAGQKDEALLVSDRGQDNRALVTEFLALLSTLNNLTFDTSFFEDSTYNSLRDESVELAPQSQGRRNPFAPIGSDTQRTVSVQNQGAR